MAKEIERKFLVDASHPQFQALMTGPYTQIHQGYLASTDKGVVRIRTADDEAFITVKGVKTGITCDEFEYPIPLNDARLMLRTLCDKVLSKRRFLFPIGSGLVIEVDVFDQIDLILAEIELPSVDRAFVRPAWLVAEVSHDPAYFNNNIIARI
ncbi:CYTH domain-containing protein [Loktanella sp. DJP18]|uniref:CYTH domain-containing protein n=1 Tax=Loktanella sp. DJP18 TaxID=3409788 RepID=UPI003BB73620